MRILRSSLPFEAMRSLYCALIYSHLMFSSLVYLNTFSSHIMPLQRQQNKALRVLKSYLPFPKLYPAKSSADSLYCFLNILPLRHSVMVESILFKLKYDRGLLPLFFRSSNLFPLKTVDYRHITRNLYKLYQPRIINKRWKFPFETR